VACHSCDCPTGPARAGSRLQIQRLINEHPELLNEALWPALTDAPADAMIQWVSPLAETDYAEYRDEAFLAALGLGRLTGSLVGNYWPRGGPCWDALATITSPGDPHFRGVILVEAEEPHPGGVRHRLPGRRASWMIRTGRHHPMRVRRS
jgi:hypothetical protein